MTDLNRGQLASGGCERDGIYTLLTRDEKMVASDRPALIIPWKSAAVSEYGQPTVEGKRTIEECLQVSFTEVCIREAC